MSYLGDMHPQAPVDASTAHADEHSSVDGGPASPSCTPSPHTVCTLLVVGQVQQLLECCQLLLVLLHCDALHLTRVPAPILLAC